MVDGGKVTRRFDGVYLDERICILRGIESIDLQLTYILETRSNFKWSNSAHQDVEAQYHGVG